ncbi:type IV pilus modification protein PilV [Marinobacterium rhizophilum]|uniref:Type IV pilus modification protein PilV n=1 Tax=Marinobacterium rhizophilum TaxID=420402 RepID=A0ABY5HHD2_9GAMM|nr:type IV pilus modification protein PilV [Marinobacterium rhizophilum]UTW11242.1 type IV pilus modification protein PilV [Marinobacterium rhizophilum]
MIEVLITLLVFSIGLLGLGAMYAQSLSISHNTYLRSLASIQAADMDERIRANPWAAADAYVLDGTQCVGLGSGAASVAVPAAVQDCGTASCAASQVVNWDLSQWCSANIDLFGGLFVSAAISSTGGDYQVDLNWQERVSGSNNQRSIDSRGFSYRLTP